MLQDFAHALKRARFRHTVLRRPLLRVRHASLKDQDVLIASYPRSGVTWMRFVLFEYLTGKSAEFGNIPKAIPYVGQQRKAEPTVVGGGRLVYSHERFLDRERSFIYLARDPRSVVLSEYRWQLKNKKYPGSFEDFLTSFLDGSSNPWGSWGGHVEMWLSEAAGRSHSFHVVRFEDMRTKALETFAGVLTFLQERVDEKRLQEAIANNTAARMREKGRHFGFVAKGDVDAWSGQLDPEQAEVIAAQFSTTLSLLGYP